LVKAPTHALPAFWRECQMVAIALLFAIMIAMLVWGGIRQRRRRIAGRSTGRRRP